MVNRKQLIILFLIVTGFLFHYTQIADWRQVLELVQRFSDHWWAWTLILGTKILLYAIAMPGSSLIWIAAILYNPVQATLLIICGGTLGGFVGYFLSKKISSKDQSEKKESIFFGFLQNNSNFTALCAARMIPGFPHSVINYGAGILDIPWLRFVLATLVGFAVKGFVYSSAIHEVIEISDISELEKLEKVWPLLLIAGLMIIGHVLKKLYIAKKQSED